jgi:hypothetical protein
LVSRHHARAVRIYSDDLDPPASPGQPVNDSGDDGFHRHLAVSRHIDVTAEAIDDAVRLNCVAASDD